VTPAYSAPSPRAESQNRSFGPRPDRTTANSGPQPKPLSPETYDRLEGIKHVWGSGQGAGGNKVRLPNGVEGAVGQRSRTVYKRVASDNRPVST
jgi:hypothetical protein